MKQDRLNLEKLKAFYWKATSEAFAPFAFVVGL
ncbi:hypothetical protein J2T12_004008 [Paenibacillus anaericanus]|nr:hypothetical protein [Paenibacillus anaericanus]